MSRPTSPLTHDQLLHLHDQLGTWQAVAASLAITQYRLDQLRRELGCSKTPKKRCKPLPSALDPYADQIRDLAAQGMTCPEMVVALELPVQDEQVRRWLHRHGIPLLAKSGAQPGAKHRDWKGGQTTDKSGYILVQHPTHPAANHAGYVREHRLVMETHLGRYLEPQERVHHINGDTGDNRIENLQLFASNAEHLAATLKGRVPNWSEDGRRRIFQRKKIVEPGDPHL